MKLPTQLTLHDCAIALDGGTTHISATDELGGQSGIKLVQHAFPRADSSPNSLAGRLYFNGQLVPMRSELEAGILALLRSAIISDDVTRAFAERVLQFVESDQYLAFQARVEQAKDTTRYDVRVVLDAGNFKLVVVRLKQILGVGLRDVIELLEQDKPVARGITALEVSDLAARYRKAGLEVRLLPVAGQQG